MSHAQFVVLPGPKNFQYPDYFSDCVRVENIMAYSAKESSDGISWWL